MPELSSKLRKLAKEQREKAQRDREEKLANTAHVARAALGLQRLRTSMGLPS